MDAPNFEVDALPRIFHFSGAWMRQELEQHGYVVVEDVRSPEFCDAQIKELKEWLGTFGPDGFPDNTKSLISKYGAGHLRY